MNKWEMLLTSKDSNFKPEKWNMPDKVREVLLSLGFEKTFKIFNVVGTNGKGSVTNYLAKSFENSGLKVGTFTSPSIYEENEHIKINGVNIRDEDFFRLAKEIPLSYFEIIFAVAMLYFQENNVDVVVLEAGMGGLTDPTNSIDGDWGVVTSIALDHTAILGDSLESIARHKAGIINEGMKFFIPSELPNEVKSIFEGTVIQNSGTTYKERNQKLVKGILDEIGIKPVFVEPEGRTEILSNNNKVAIIDVAHNYDGIKETLKYLDQMNITFDQVVISMSKRKLIHGIVDLFKGEKIVVYVHDETYHNGEDFGLEEIKDLSKFVNNQKLNTLYIGTFKNIRIIKNSIK